MAIERPANLTEILRDLNDRLTAVETRDVVTIGPWVLELNDTDELVARHAPTDTVIVLATPPA